MFRIIKYPLLEKLGITRTLIDLPGISGMPASLRINKNPFVNSVQFGPQQLFSNGNNKIPLWRRLLGSPACHSTMQNTPLLVDKQFLENMIKKIQKGE